MENVSLEKKNTQLVRYKKTTLPRGAASNGHGLRVLKNSQKVISTKIV